MYYSLIIALYYNLTIKIEKQLDNWIKITKNNWKNFFLKNTYGRPYFATIGHAKTTTTKLCILQMF